MGAYSESDVGKPVVTIEGTRVGTVQEVRDDTLFVEPVADLDPDIESHLRWDGPVNQEVHRLINEFVASVNDHEIRLRI